MTTFNIFFVANKMSMDWVWTQLYTPYFHHFKTLEIVVTFQSKLVSNGFQEIASAEIDQNRNEIQSVDSLFLDNP